MKLTEEKRFELAVDDLAKRQPVLWMEVDTITAIVAVSFLQLALRHPAGNGPSGQRVRVLVDNFIDVIHRQSPFLADMLRRGDDPALDVER